MLFTQLFRSEHTARTEYYIRYLRQISYFSHINIKNGVLDYRYTDRVGTGPLVGVALLHSVEDLRFYETNTGKINKLRNV